MSKLHPADFSFEDVMQWVLPDPNIPDAFTGDDELFPPPDYRGGCGGYFWRAQTIRNWITSNAWAEILSRPRVLEALAKHLQAFSTTGYGCSFNRAEARRVAAERFVASRLARMTRLRYEASVSPLRARPQPSAPGGGRE